MKKVFSTADVHPRHRFDYWHEVACKKIVGFEATPLNHPKFAASLQVADLAGMGLVMFENTPMDAARTAKNIAQEKDDCLLICRQIRGAVRLDQDSRQTLLKAGELTVIDPQRPYTADFVSLSKMLLFKVPRHAFEQRYGRVGECSGRVVRRDNRIGAFAADHLALLPRHALMLEPAAAATVSAYALDLISLSLFRLTEKGKPFRSTARSLAVSNLRAFIDMRLGDPELDPTSVAAGTGISLRYAQALLAEEGTSITRLIQERRLNQCERALANPARRHRTVSEIAFAWGFTDLTHFGRLFKKRFGMTPRDYRSNRLAKAQKGRAENSR